MYKIQPILTKEQIQTSSCMYSMKSIYDDDDDPKKNANKIVPGVSHKSSYKLRDISQQISTFLKVFFHRQMYSVYLSIYILNFVSLSLKTKSKLHFIYIKL